MNLTINLCDGSKEGKVSIPARAVHYANAIRSVFIASLYETDGVWRYELNGRKERE
jgi:hypothetical protein